MITSNFENILWAWSSVKYALDLVHVTQVLSIARLSLTNLMQFVDQNFDNIQKLLDLIKHRFVSFI